MTDKPHYAFDAPNLDGLHTDDLIVLRNVLDLLAAYANKKLCAIQLREAREVQAAQRAEEECEGFYKRLPEWARW